MKAVKITYWITTSLISFMMLLSANAHFTRPQVAESFNRLGFPDFFRVELGVAKIIGAIVLLVPLPNRVKEWAYAGFGITLISAAIAHIVYHDPVGNIIFPLAILGVLVASYITWTKKNTLA